MGIEHKGSTSTPKVELEQSSQLQSLITLLSAKESDISATTAIKGLQETLSSFNDDASVKKAFEDFVASASDKKATFDFDAIKKELDNFNNTILNAASPDADDDVIQVLKHFVENAKPSAVLDSASTPTQKGVAGADIIIDLMDKVKMDTIDPNKVAPVSVEKPSEKETTPPKIDIDISNVKTPELNALISKYFVENKTDLKDGVSMEFLQEAEDIADLLELEKEIQSDLFKTAQDAEKASFEANDSAGHSKAQKEREAASETLNGIYAINMRTAEALENEKKGGGSVDKSILKKWNKGANESLASLDEAAGKSKSGFDKLQQGTALFSSSLGTLENRFTEISSSLTDASKGLSDTTSETSGYLNKFQGVIGSLTSPLALLGAAAGLAGLAISGFQKKLDIGRSYGAAGGGEGMVEQLRQMHVTSLIDPASLKALGDGMSKNFNVGLGRNQKEMTRVATKQRLSERVMGKEYADGQMEAINDMKTVLAGQSPSGMMDDLTAQTSALAKTMGVSNKYALEQIKAIHENSKLITKGMNADAAKAIEGTMQGMAAQMKEAGYTEAYIKETLEFASMAASDDEANQDATQNALMVKGIGGEGAEYAEKAYDQMGMTQDSALQLMNKRAQLGFDGLTEDEKKKYLEVQKINKQSQEVMYADLSKKVNEGTATAKEIETLQVIRQKKGLQKSSETANKTVKDLLDANKSGKEKLEMNKASAESSPAVDKLLVTMQSQAGNEGKSRKELMSQLMTNMVSNGEVSSEQKEAIKANLTKRQEQGMKDGSFDTMEEYLASLSEDQQKQLDADAFTTVMGASMTDAVSKMEKGQGPGLGGVSSTELKNKVKSDTYENDRVSLVSNKVENAGDDAQRALIKANNFMERGIMDIVNSAIPYLMDAFEYLADHMKEIGAILGVVLGGALLWKIFKGLKALSKGTGILSKVFKGLFGTVKLLGKGFWGLSTGISNMLIKGLKVFLNPAKWFKALLWTIKAPFSFLTTVIKGIGSLLSGFGKAVSTVTSTTINAVRGIGKAVTSPIQTIKKVTGKTGKFANNVKSSPTATKLGEKIKKANPKSIMSNIKVEQKLLKAADASKIKNLNRVKKLEKVARVAKAAGDANKAAKASALALKVSAKVAKGGTVAMLAAEKAGLFSKGLAGAAKGFSKFLGPLGVAITLAMAAKGAYDGWNNASELLGLNAVKSEADAIKMGAALDESGNAMRNAAGEFIDENNNVIREVASNGQKFSSALGGVVSSLSFGLVTAAESAQWFDANFGATWDHIGVIWDNIVKAAKGLWDDTMAIFGPAFESLKQIFDDIVTIVFAPFKAIMALFAGDTEGAKNAIGGALSAMKDLFFAIPKFLADAFIGVFDWFVNLGTRLWGSFTRMMTDVGIWWSSVDLWDDFGKPFIEGIINVGKAIWGGIKDVWKSITGWITGLFSDTEAELAAKETAKKLDLNGMTDQSKDEIKEDMKQKNVSSEDIAALIKANETAGIGGFGELANVDEITALKEILAERNQTDLLKDKDENQDFNIDTDNLMNSGKKGEDGLIELDFSSLKSKSYESLNNLYNDQAAQMTESSREKLKLMISDSKTETVINAEAKTEKRKLERKENADNLKGKASDFVATTDPTIDAAKVAVGGIGSDAVLKDVNDGSALAMAGSIGDSFDSVMVKSNEVASSGFKSVVAAIKGVDYTPGTSENNATVSEKDLVKSTKETKNVKQSKAALQVKEAEYVKTKEAKEAKEVKTNKVLTGKGISQTTKDSLSTVTTTANNYTPTSVKDVDESATVKSGSIDVVALQKLHEKIIKDGGKSKDDLLKGLAINGEKQSKTMGDNNRAFNKMKTKGWEALKKEEKKRVLKANALLNKKAKETPKGGDKTKNGNAVKNQKVVANAVAKATEKQLVSSDEGAAMNEDLKNLVKGDKKDELVKKLKAMGHTIESISGMAYNVEKGGKQSKKSQEALLQAKNIMSVMQGSKSQKQVDLEQGKSKRLKQTSQQFVADKANAIHNEDLTTTKTGKYLVEKDKLDMQMKTAKKAGNKEEIARLKGEQKKLAEANPQMVKEAAYLEKKDALDDEMKKAKKSGNKEEIAKVKAKQDELAKTDVGKLDKDGKLTMDADKAKEVKSKMQIKKDIKNGKMDEAKKATKALYSKGLAEHQKDQETKIDGEIATEKLKHKKSKGYVPETKVVSGKETTKLDAKGKTIVTGNESPSIKTDNANATVKAEDLEIAPSGVKSKGVATAVSVTKVDTPTRTTPVADVSVTKQKAIAKSQNESKKHDQTKTKDEADAGAGGNAEVLKLLQQIVNSNNNISTNSTRSVSLDAKRNEIAQKNLKANADRMDTNRQQAITDKGNA